MGKISALSCSCCPLKRPQFLSHQNLSSAPKQTIELSLDLMAWEFCQEYSSFHEEKFIIGHSIFSQNWRSVAKVDWAENSAPGKSISEHTRSISALFRSSCCQPPFFVFCQLCLCGNAQILLTTCNHVEALSATESFCYHQTSKRPLL